VKECRFHAQVWLPRPRHEVFAFFADARNLQALTPAWLNFEVLTPAPITLRAGTIIDYHLRVHGVPIRWRSEITLWDPPRQFADMQLRGPYALWQHTHIFDEQDGGTLCRDEVRYWPRGGRLANWLFVRRDVERIFRYREQRLSEIFKAAAPN
jgi:ligand-binding SRPBCC domain-containing protein